MIDLLTIMKAAFILFDFLLWPSLSYHIKNMPCAACPHPNFPSSKFFSMSFFPSSGCKNQDANLAECFIYHPDRMTEIIWYPLEFPRPKNQSLKKQTLQFRGQILFFFFFFRLSIVSLKKQTLEFIIELKHLFFIIIF